MMRPFSPKRARQIKSGELKLTGTFKRKSMAEIVAAQAEMRGQVINEIFGKKKPLVPLPADARSRAIQAADKWFSKWIRLRDSDENGIATCVTSGKRAYWATMDCGHYVSRAKQSTRYDEMNCHAQSKMSNRFQGGHFVEHGNRIDELHGPGTAEKLRQKGLQRCSRTTEDFLFIANTYKQRVAWIAQHEPNKFKKP